LTRDEEDTRFTTLGTSLVDIASRRRSVNGQAHTVFNSCLKEAFDATWPDSDEIAAAFEAVSGAIKRQLDQTAVEDQKQTCLELLVCFMT
jgi:hypothetical protein